MRSLKIAGVQVESRNGETRRNLSRAEEYVVSAAAQGAELVVCPEFLAAGYVWHKAIWEAAEPAGGPTETWLKKMALAHQIFICATYLQLEGCDFFNTFVLVNPDGTVAGRVRKESLPAFEGWYFRGCSGPKVIDTEIGRIGVGICQDSHTSRFARRIFAEGVDLLLMPHSGPWVMGLGRAVREAVSEGQQHIAPSYARAFGVPAVMVNKASKSESTSPVPLFPFVRLRFRFPGGSTICDGGGDLLHRLGEEEGVVIAEVTLDPSRKTRPRQKPRGYWFSPPKQLPWLSGALLILFEQLGKVAYALSWARRRAARRPQK